MVEKIVIPSEDREEIIRGHRDKFPKYTTQLLNIANQNSQATRPKHIGNMNKLIKEFESKNPGGNYEDWVDYYTESQNGEEKLSRSAELLFNMVKKMEEAMGEIDQDMAYKYIEQLVLYKSYIGNRNDIKELIFRKLDETYPYEVTLESDSWIFAHVNNTPVVIQSQNSSVDEKPKGNVAVIYYDIKADNSVELDLYDLNKRLGVTVSKDGGVNSRIDNFSII